MSGLWLLVGFLSIVFGLLVGAGLGAILKERMKKKKEKR